MPQGTLALTVTNVSHLPSHLMEDQVQFNVVIAGQKKSGALNERLHFDLKEVNGSNSISVEITTGTKKQKRVLASGTTSMNTVENKKTTISLSDDIEVVVDGIWTIKNATQKYAGTNTAQTVDSVKETTAAVATFNPERGLTSSSELHRPKFLRALFYYDTTKNVYNYSTSFRLIASLARFTEQSANVVLQKVTGKNLHELDDGIVVPALSTLDNKVDDTFTTLFVTLAQGQMYALQKKNDVVETASTVAKKSSEQLSNVVETTWKTVTQAKEYTTSSIYSVSSSAYEKACNVTDYTTSQVVNVSSSTLGSVRSAGVYLVSHVPYLGAKIRT